MSKRGTQSTARYRFRKNLRVPARGAYAWLTDFGADDLELMGSQGRREAFRLTPDVYLLIDHIRRAGRPVRKTKLVHLYPEDFSWISTYIGGPSNRSQFLYQIEAVGPRRSRFTFTGLHMEHGSDAPQGAKLAQYSRQLQVEDSATWTRIVRELHRALTPSRRRRRG